MEREERLLRLAIDAAHSIVRDEEWAPPLLAALHQLLDIDAGLGLAQVRSLDPAHPAPEAVRITMQGGQDLTDDQARAAYASAPQDPLVVMMAHGRLSETTGMSRHVRMPRLWGTEAYYAMHGIFDARYPAAMPLGRHGPATYFIGMHRRRRDFTDVELSLVDHIRPPIFAALQFRAQLDAASLRLAQLSGEDEASDRSTELTRRQREVLALVAAGWTNRQIGRRLGIAERTVRKHLEDIFERLHVGSRTAAASRWQQVAKLPQPEGLTQLPPKGAWSASWN